MSVRALWNALQMSGIECRAPGEDDRALVAGVLRPPLLDHALQVAQVLVHLLEREADAKKRSAASPGSARVRPSARTASTSAS